jgi:hypothetical protein
MRSTWAMLIEVGFKNQGEEIEFDHRSYERQGIDIIPQVKEGKGRAMSKRGKHSERVETNRQIKAANEEIENDPIIQTLEKNLQALEKLSGWNLKEGSCIETKSVWNGNAYENRYALKVNEAMNLVEKLAEKVPVFEELFEDFNRLKRRTNDDHDFEPVIEDVPEDSTIGDLFVMIAEEISKRGLRQTWNRTRSRVRTKTAKSVDMDR